MAPIVEGYGADAAAWKALAAGEDLLLIPTDPAAARDGIVAAVAAGQLPAERLQQAAVRVLALRLATGRARAGRRWTSSAPTPTRRSPRRPAPRADRVGRRGRAGS